MKSSSDDFWWKSVSFILRWESVFHNFRRKSSHGWGLARNNCEVPVIAVMAVKDHLSSRIVNTIPVRENDHRSFCIPIKYSY